MYELQFYFVRTREAALMKKISDSSFSFSFRLSSEKVQASARADVWHHRKTWKKGRKKHKRKREREVKSKCKGQKKGLKPKQNVWAWDMDEEEYLGWTSKT
jgi:hypothetical protein